MEQRETTSFGIEQIKQILPHREPFLMVDRVDELVPGKTAKCVKAVSGNEWYFQGHFDQKKVMPGVLIVEAMAQAGAVILLTSPEYAGRVPVIGAIDDVKFKRPIVPGDTLITDVELLWIRSGVGRIKAVGTVEGQVAASMELTFKMIPRAE